MAGELLVVGVSWRTAPVSVREQLAFRDDELAPALAEILASPNVAEAVIVSTCNRVEIYSAAAGPSGSAAASELRSFLARSRSVAAEGLSSHLYERSDDDAVRHLFRVASALDSMVVGESQILGQLKDAYGVALRASATGPLLNRSMERAFGVAKRVRSETGIARGAANVSSVAVELAERVYGELTGKVVLVVGAGKMSALAARHLRSAGCGAIDVTNRSLERAVELAAQVEGRARPWDDLPGLLASADVVISSTGATEPVLTVRLVKAALKARRHRPLVVIDIAVPRDADAAIGKLDDVYLFDIDDLRRVVDANLNDRQREAEAAHEIVDEEVGEFARWLRGQRAVPTIRSLREHFHAVATAEAEKAIAGLGPAAAQDVGQAIRRLSQVIANKLLHTPMTALKGGSDDVDVLTGAAQRLFQLGGDEAPGVAPASEDAPKAEETADQASDKRSAR